MIKKKKYTSTSNFIQPQEAQIIKPDFKCFSLQLKWFDFIIICVAV